MGLPQRVRQGSWQHWLGRVLLFGFVGVFMYRAVTEWSRSGLGLLVDALIIAIAVTGLNLITGYTGQLSLGHAGFFAIGAFVSAMLVSGRIWTPSMLKYPSCTFLASVVAGSVALVCVIVAFPGSPAQLNWPS